MPPPPPPPAEGFATRLLLGPALRTQSDRRLVTLVRDGYEAAFEEIVRRYAKPLGRYAAGIVGSRSEDVTQDAFSKALLALRKDSEADIELRPWLYRIVRNTALNDLRDGPPPSAELTEPLAGGLPSAAEEVERRQELEELLERLRALPDPQRAAIVMRELEGLGHEEIAKSLGMSGGAARQSIFRARQALRDGLGFLIPLPVVRTLLEHTAGAEAGIAAGAGGGIIAAGSAAGAGGAGTALKVGVVAAVLAGSVGTGLAIKDRPQDRGPETAEAAAPAAAGERAAGDDSGGPPGAGEDRSGRGAEDGGRADRHDDRSDEGGEGSSGTSGGGGSGSGRDHTEDGPHHGGRGPDRGGDSGPGGGDGARHGGPGPSGGGRGPSGGDDGGDHGGDSGSSGPGSGDSGSGDTGSSGPGSGDSGSSSEGGSGSDSGSALPPPPPGDSSGPGGGDDSSSGSGSGSGDGFEDGGSSGSGDGLYLP